MKSSSHRSLSASLLICTMLLGPALALAKPGIAITLAKRSGGSLTVKGRLSGHTAATVDLYDGSGRLLGQPEVQSNRRFTLTTTVPEQPELLCSVLAKSGKAAASATVKGRDKSCAKVPVCKISLPLASVQTSVDTNVKFRGTATLKDKAAKPLRIEWDFGGGAMGEAISLPNQDAFKRPDGKKATVRFARDNGRYRVRLTAWDKKNRYCEDSVEVVVGTPPDSAPGFQSNLASVKAMAKTSQDSAPKAATTLAAGKVVIPYEERSMQCVSDTRLLPDGSWSYPPAANTVKAYVYEKALQPVPLGTDQVELRYSAASNPSDPAGPQSINSTSRNWPLDAKYANATLQKGELFERYEPGANEELGVGYSSATLIEATRCTFVSCGESVLKPDEGINPPALDPPVNADHGRYMPGIEAPYAENRPQPFGEFNATSTLHQAAWLPLTDVDDSGRVNPTSLVRVEAVEPGSETAIAATDITVTSGHDHHCRGCHAYGRIGANPDVARSSRAYFFLQTSVMWMPETGHSLADQEADALMNATMLHAFYDGNHIGMFEMMEFEDSMRYRDGPFTCGNGCHFEPPLPSMFTGQLGSSSAGRGGWGSMSNALHRLHGSLQYNDDRTDILRDGNGRYRCSQDPNKENCDIDPARSLFPVRSAQGKILPMEENCLKCHNGEREQCYRDRMYTAGVTCYQCHGDLLAVAGLYEKPFPNPDGNRYRMEWLDQPDCGSCHTGSGNQSGPGYFNAGVKTLAFDENDKSATPHRVDLSNPDQRRFAVVPLADLPQQNFGTIWANLQTPLFRLGQDRHGKVACAACHGAAHSIWPNRNPGANDNVTALELQGHAGHLLECNVCHTSDSFARREDLDESIKIADRQDGVLGGPHNLHPINDEHWWKAAAGDEPNKKDGSTSGGWHNDYARTPGADGEDQCAACHGNDHKGTRLSRAPVDRVFDFSDAPDLDKLKKAGIKPVVKVKAGTPIGCDTCHNIALSCTDSPNPQCGQPSDHVTGNGNQPPHLEPPLIVDARVGQPLSHTVTASDPDGDPVTIRSPIIDDAGHLVTNDFTVRDWLLEARPQARQIPPTFPVDYDLPLMVYDNRGGYSADHLTIRISCPDSSLWDVYTQFCQALSFTEADHLTGIDAGTVWQYTVPAVSAIGETLSYTLLDPVPPGMTVDATGRISFDTRNIPIDTYYPVVRVGDSHDHTANFSLNLTLCKPPMHWNPTLNGCSGAVHITSTPPEGLNIDEPLDYQVVATQDNGRPLTYALISPPAGATISDSGLIHWSSMGYSFPEVAFTVEVGDGQGSLAQQVFPIMVCSGETPIWSPTTSMGGNGCVFGRVRFKTQSPTNLSAGQAYQYALSARDTGHLPIALALENAPAGMSLDVSSIPTNGTANITWDSTGFEGQTVQFRIVATDSQNGWARQTVNLAICPADTPTWDADQGICVP